MELPHGPRSAVITGSGPGTGNGVGTGYPGSVMGSRTRRSLGSRGTKTGQEHEVQEEECGRGNCHCCKTGRPAPKWDWRLICIEKPT